MKEAEVMLTRSKRAASNVSECVSMMIKGAKKRRSYAIAAVKSLNADMGMGVNLAVVK